MVIGKFMKGLRVFAYVMLVLVPLGSPQALASTQSDFNSIFTNTPYYDPNACAGGSAAASGATGAGISGDIKSLAQQVLDSKNITFDYGDNGPAGTQFKRLADGQKAQTETGRQVDVQPILLVALLYLAQDHKVQVSSLTDGRSHTAPDNPHGMGDAMDIDFFDGAGTNGSDSVAMKIINSLEEVLPSGSRFGMGNNPFGTQTAHGKTFTSFTDAPNHVHFDVVGVSQAADDAAVQAASGIAGSTVPGEPGSSGTCCDNGLVGGPAGTGPLFGLEFPKVADAAELASRIEKYVKDTVPSSPFVTMGDQFVAAGEKYNVNPTLEVAIAFKESTLGINQVPGSHDAWGLTAVGDVSGYPYIGGEYAFPSWTVGIYEATKYMSTTFVAPNAPLHSTSVYQMMTHYTPGDPAGQTAITLDQMHKMLDGIATGGAGISLPISAGGGGGCSSDTATPQVNIIKHDVFGNGDGLMGHQPTMIGLHYTEGNPQTVDDVVSMLKDPTGVKGCSHITHSCSVQLTIDPKGNVYQLTSRLDVITENIINFNNADIGIEIMGSGQQALLSNDVQFKAVVATVAQLMQQYNIKMVEDFSHKAGLMGHMECDSWSQAHLGQHFKGTYAGDTVQSTDGHQDPGDQYMSKVRAAVGTAIGQ